MDSVKGGKSSWETMQRDENGKITLFRRGEGEDNQMKGMFSIQKDSKKILRNL